MLKSTLKVPAVSQSLPIGNLLYASFCGSSVQYSIHSEQASTARSPRSEFMSCECHMKVGSELPSFVSTAGLCSSRGVNFRQFINFSSPFTNRLVHLQMDWLIRKYAAYLQMGCIFAYGLKWCLDCIKVSDRISGSISHRHQPSLLPIGIPY